MKALYRGRQMAVRRRALFSDRCGGVFQYIHIYIYIYEFSDVYEFLCSETPAETTFWRLVETDTAIVGLLRRIARLQNHCFPRIWLYLFPKSQSLLKGRKFDELEIKPKVTVLLRAQS
jgi:hypothetical protein